MQAVYSEEKRSNLTDFQSPTIFNGNSTEYFQLEREEEQQQKNAPNRI